jgi:hypothetical protein
MGVIAIRRPIILSSRAWGRLLLVASALFLFSGCHYTDGLSVAVIPDGRSSLNRLALLPFKEIIPAEAAGKMVSCPLCGKVFQSDGASFASATAVENLFYGRLQMYENLAFIPPESAGEVYRRKTASFNKIPLPEIVKQVGAELGADGVIVGYVFRFRERQGYPYSVEKPASVAFDIHLVRVSDGVVVWQAAFDKTQSSLMENMFLISSFYKRGGKWVTARELADEGVTEMLKSFPGLW